MSAYDKLIAQYGEVWVAARISREEADRMERDNRTDESMKDTNQIISVISDGDVAEGYVDQDHEPMYRPNRMANPDGLRKEDWYNPELITGGRHRMTYLSFVNRLHGAGQPVVTVDWLARHLDGKS